ncbi:hypothetical protein AB0Y38_09160 [Lysinibacillus capsici]|uniref:Uncharacterized protein n=2 Tax=Bacillaceae TaxID=186817 RepID=A0ABY8KIK9_9BACI|nr:MULTISPECIES: hypothetical protein [Lysinibacillus]MCS5499775.1 hypothetical protein [Lysinibacillus sp. A4]MCM0623075.1 hypothetical protein [Lysinibacillus sp. OL1_EC]MCS1390926.1 hypothetical protein [Lysinibacillus boronitolerans]MCT1569684.1 hypothetical protein [Lysinibacillus capsici]MCT1647142.1 hypothetical protein [Lysinibacillus capsici]
MMKTLVNDLDILKPYVRNPCLIVQYAIKEAITDFEIEVLNKEDEKLKILNLQILLINVL